MEGAVTSPSLAWKYSLKIKRDVRARSPVINGNAVYAVFQYSKGGFYESSLTSFDLSTGEIRWTFLVDHTCSQPVVDAGGNVYLSSFGGSVYALDADGRERWRSPIVRQNLWMPCLGEDGSLIVAEIGGGSRNTWCLESGTGKVRWKFENRGHSYSIASAQDKVVHATARRDPDPEGVSLYCLSLNDGRPVWTCDSPEYLFKPCIVDGSVFIGARGSFRAYDLKTGRILDRLEMPSGVALNSEILARDKRLYVGDENGTLLAIASLESRSLLGKKLRLARSWDFKCDGEASSRPVADESRVLFLSKRGVIHIFDIASGRQLGEIRFGTGEDAGGLALAERTLVAAHGRQLHCYHL